MFSFLKKIIKIQTKKKQKQKQNANNGGSKWVRGTTPRGRGLGGCAHGLFHGVSSHHLAEDFFCLSVFCLGLLLDHCRKSFLDLLLSNLQLSEILCWKFYEMHYIFFSNFQALHRKVTPKVLSFQAEKFPVSNHLKLTQHDWVYFEI